MEVNGGALEAPDTVDGQVAVLPAENSKIIKKMVPRPADGLVRESNDKRVITHEEVKDYLETEDVRNLGDFSDEVSGTTFSVIHIFYFFYFLNSQTLLGHLKLYW